MTLTYSKFSSFDEVVYHYNNTKPMGGSTNKGKDIRPIGDRGRKYERIVKISRNCYALSDGFHFGDPHFGQLLAWLPDYPYPADMEKYAPIVWRKKRDGTEEVTLRNGWGPGAHNGRYAFLYRHSPKNMWFRNRNSKHFMEVLNGEDYTSYYLAKTRTAPRVVYDYYMNQSDNRWMKRIKNWVMMHDDNSAVTFRKTENGWVHVEGTGRSPLEAKGPTVNKKIKDKYKDAIKKFFEWGMIMSPLLPIERDYNMERMDELRKHFHPHTSYREWQPEWFREVLENEDHPMRLQFWVFFASTTSDGWHYNQTYRVKEVQTKDDLRRVRAKFNSFINTRAGFMKQ